MSLLSESFLQRANNADAVDPLAPLAEKFYRREGVNYLLGNSLGPLSKASESSLLRVIEEWKTLGVRGWEAGAEPWFIWTEKLSAQIAQIVGAAPEEAVLANSLTVNLHQLLGTLFKPAGGRQKILTHELTFPSDRYALQGHLGMRGLDPVKNLVTVSSEDGLTLDEDVIIESMSDREVQMAVLPSVLYRSGQLLDLPLLTEAAHERGILIGFDLAHSVGVMPHQLSEWGVDFAFFCTYKFLNGGPGSVGGIYLNKRHFGKAPGLAGWFSAAPEKRFTGHEFLPDCGNALALQTGTPAILSLAPLEGALGITLEAGLEGIREKSLKMTQFLIDGLQNEMKGLGVAIATPLEPERRGGHVAILHDDAANLAKVLRESGVIVDFRAPNLIRIAPSPLFNRFVDCASALGQIKKILTTEGCLGLQGETALVP